MRGIEYIGLHELQMRIQDVVTDNFSEPVWVKAEISEIKYNPSGHCYLTLVEKDENSNALIAKGTAIVWASTFRTLRPFFESQTGTVLAAGMAVLVRAQIQYSELYGLSLIICDIDPSFTVGELELQRQRTIERLKEEGMFEMNSSLSLAKLPHRFALISSPTAAGYRDFMKHLAENEYGYHFQVTLFDALMQGNDSPASIIRALDEIAAVADKFDAVLIMRGGGGAMDLVCFDDYELAVNVSQFPLPVMTGVGHDHDYHVIDMVAHTSVKTPTALADHIVNLIAEEEYFIDSLAQRMRLSLKEKFGIQKAGIDAFLMRVRSAVALRSISELHRIEILESRVVAANPAEVLGKGFALVLKEGRRVSSVNSFSEGDRVTIMLKDGKIEAKI